MPQFQRFCIYCGGTRLTKEHLYPAWLQEYIQDRVDQHGIRLFIFSPKSTARGIDLRTGDTHSRKVRRVCAVCNNGWMSQLQTAAKPFLVPMIKGEPMVLPRRAQKIVCAWCAMLSMNCEFVNDKFVAIPQEDRDYLRIVGRTPKGWRIWIGRYRWESRIERWTHHTMCLAEQGYEGPAGETGHPANTQTTTMCIGNNFFFHAISSSVDTGQNIIKRVSLPPPLSAAMRQVGPAAAETVRWPPNHALGLAEVTWLANALAERCRTILYQQTAGAA